jgi:xanthine dehydrogenase accessory factor
MVSAHLEAIRRLQDEERLGAAVTVLSGPDEGSHAVLEADVGVVEGKLPPGLEDHILDDARQLMDQEQSRTLEYDDDVSVFIETVAPQPSLVIFGAVHIAQPLAAFATELGFRVTVSDSRPAFTTAERFPHAEVALGRPEEVLADLELDRRTYVVVLSHDARFEDPVFPAVLRSPVRYIGAMGSRRTHAARRERLLAAGFDTEAIDRIHGPIGLDIGAEVPAEVAISILAEMIQVRYGAGTGRSLRGREGRIHRQRTDDEGDI